MRLLLVLGKFEGHETVEIGIRRLAQRRIHPERNRFLGEPHRQRRQSGNVLGDFHCLRHYLGMRHQPLREADAVGFLGLQRKAHRDLHRLSPADPAREAHRATLRRQDAELGALQRIVAGTQSMTVYKPIVKLAPAAVDAAFALAKGEKLKTTRTVNNGKIDVPSILIEPVSVDKTNIDETVIKDGFQKKEDVYRQP